MRDADDARKGEDEPLEDLEVTAEDADEVRGGLAPPSPPGGPIPIPYPNTKQ
jgi:hypothetical protein